MLETAAIPLFAFAFLVSFVYSSVGHGGASGYLALLSFYSFSHQAMSASALCLNLLVSAMAYYSFARAGHFSWRLTWPFVLSSVPAAFAGGLIRMPPVLYALLLAFVLFIAGLRLLTDAQSRFEEIYAAVPPVGLCLFLGLAIGLLSGIVGVGGGIFLSPLILFYHWAGPKQTAATSAFFIFANSLAGLLGRFIKQHAMLQLSPVLAVMVAAAFCGGFLGSRMGARHFSGRWLKRILALVLFMASFKLVRLL